MNGFVSLSLRLYRALLRAYPPSFRAEYADEMALTFCDECRARHLRNGAAGVVGEWVVTVPDYLVSVVDEHAQENFYMAKTNLVRLLALAGIVGGALWIAFGVILSMRAPGIPGGAYRQADDVAPLVIFGVGLVSAGLLAVALRPARMWPVVTRGLLLLAVAGGLWVSASSFFTSNFLVFLAGFLGQSAGLALAGLSLLRSAARRPWAVLLVALAASMFLFNTEDWRAVFGVAAGILVIVISALALSRALDRQSEPPVAAA